MSYSDSSHHTSTNPISSNSAGNQDDNPESKTTGFPPCDNKKSIAFIETATPLQRMSPASLTVTSPCEKKTHNARSLSSTSGSRLISQNWGMPASTDSTNVVCTSLKVPSPQAGVAAQSQTGVQLASMAMDGEPSIKKENKRMQQNSVKSTFTNNGIENRKKDTLSSNEYCEIYKTNENAAEFFGSSCEVEIINHEDYTCVQGHIHQGNSMFRESAGNQCVANCFVAALYKLQKSVHDWDPYDMNTILVTGNELYKYMQASSQIHHPLLMVNELPSDIEMFSQTYQTQIHESIASVIDQGDCRQNLTEFNAFELKESLQISLIDSCACFLCFADSTILIGKESNEFYVFDPHARNSRGLVCANGTSTCLIFHDLDNVCSHIYQLAVSMGVTDVIQCEVTGVTITVNRQSKTEVKERQEFVKPQNDQEVQFIASSLGSTNFTPLSFDSQSTICKEFGFAMLKKDTNHSAHDALRPKECHSIHGDGNCFFRAVSFSVSNTDNNHQLIRSLVCKHAEAESSIFRSFLRNSSEDVKAYIKRKGMHQNGKWATEFEIIVSAHLLKCYIYTFSDGKWLVYKPPGTEQDRIRGSIYLDHVNGNHYNVVQNVETRNRILEKARSRLEKFNRNKKIKKEKIAQRKRINRALKSNSSCREHIKTSNMSNSDTMIEGRQSGAHMNEGHYKNQIPSIRLNCLECRKHGNNGNKKIQNQISYQKGTSEFQQNKNCPCCELLYSMENEIDKTKEKKQIIHTSSNTTKTEKRNKENKGNQSCRANKKRNEVKKTKLGDIHKPKSSKRKKNNENSNKPREAQSLKRKKNNENSDKPREQQSLKRKNNNENSDKAREPQSLKRKKNNENSNKPREPKSLNKKKNNENSDKPREPQSLKRKKNNENSDKPREPQSLKRKKNNKNSNHPYETLIDKFRFEARKGPVYACACCHRLLFDNQVSHCIPESYSKKNAVVSSIAQGCILDKYKHICTQSCNNNCRESAMWICKTCHRKILSGKVPAESFANGLLLEDVPECLAILNSLEKHLVAKHITFMKMMALPQGGQNAVRGPVVCVPVNMDAVTSLPRHESNNLILRVKLKRKLCYKGYYEYQFVNTSHVHKALQYLLEKNKWYKDVEIKHESNDDVETVIVSCQSDMETITNQSSSISNSDGSSDRQKSAMDSEIEVELSCTNEHKEFEKLNNEGETSVQYDTCLQPCDIGQEVLDYYYDDIFSLAPAEGKNPVRVLQSCGNEAMSFPTLFPSGINTYDQERTVPITLSRYYNNRLMHADGRFAKDTNYIFYSQYVSELKQVIDKTQICLRKAKSKSFEGKKITEDTLLNNCKLRKILHNDEALRFMQPIRGTPSYWQNTQKDLFAMLRQIGIPTWFCSFSAAEFRWPEIVNTILHQQNSDKDFYDLDWTQKSKLLKNDPVSVARMFDHRFHLFLKMIIFSELEPIGKVTDYFYRVEFQQRGSPHVHCLFWIEDAPKIEDGREKVSMFIDKYITCKLPLKEDEDLREIVENVQCHSQKHSKSCRKGNKTCRFNFPRPPSNKTFIAQPNEQNDIKKYDSAEQALQVDAEAGMTMEQAKEIFNTLWEGIQNGRFKQCSDLFQNVGVNQQELETAYDVITNKRVIVLKREPSEVWINQYNPILLRCWNANMDIQYVLDAFSCIVYIVSYISKGEREMGMLLKQTQTEAQEGNLSAQQTMKKVGSAYLNHREVGVQEAVYRICGLHMKECSRQVVFIPIGENPVRISRPLAELRRKKKTDSIQDGESTESDEDSGNEKVWLPNSVDKYLARPQLSEFEKMCLAVFCSAYRFIARSQASKDNKNVYELQQDMGFIQKRTRSENAIIRYFRANAVKSPEAFYRSLLQLFLPYWFERQLKPPGYELYESFYKSGCVRFANDCKLYKVKDIVDANKSDFVRNEEIIDEAEEQLEQIGNLEDAWGNLCPESEKHRHECITDNNDRIDENDVPVEFTSDLIPIDTNSIGSLFTIDHGEISKLAIGQILQSLNDKQKSVFYFVRDWCLRKVLSENPDPFYFFVTGGAGTGKSHLISAIKYEAGRVMSRLSPDADKITIALTAFTGTAAFNISGCTVHHIFKLKKRLPLPYEPLTEQALSPLRSSLEHLEILVIDEVSMIYKRLLYYIHERLVQIKRIKAPFGGVSVLAVGDFFQLPPVKQPKQERLYNSSASYPIDYWNELFKLVELDEIMRQKDDKVFAEMLNTVRIRTSNQPLPTYVCEMLKSRKKDGPNTALHIFSTNNEVNSYNTQLINQECDLISEIPANDYRKDSTSGKYIKLEKSQAGCQNTSNSKNSNDQMPSILLLAPGARVMLTRNINVADGLANGVIGTVNEIVTTNGSASSQQQVKLIRVIFDDERVGKESGKKVNDKIVVDIQRVEDEPTKSCVIRHQFPLKLAWACTAHKVQGMTCKEIVVNLDKVFSPGQAYVALSRATTLEGLYLQYSNDNILDSKLYADKDVQSALVSMKRFTVDFLKVGAKNIEDSQMNITLHNIQSLASHIHYLQNDDRFLTSDAIFLTETWIENTMKNREFSLKDFICHHKTREDSYSSSNPQTQNMKISKGGGISVFYKNESEVTVCNTIRCTNIEAMITSMHGGKLYVVVVYNPPSYSSSMFLNNLVEIISKLRKLSKAIIVMGDFNENALKADGPIQKKMKELGFKQIVKDRTTEQGTLIDHVYISENVQASCSIVPTFYSYHEAVAINITNAE